MNIKTILSILTPNIIKGIFSKTANPFNTIEAYNEYIPSLTTEKDKSIITNNFNLNPNLVDYSKSANNIDPYEYTKEFVKNMESWDDNLIDSLDEKARLIDEQLIESYSIDGWELIHTEEGQKIVDLYAEKLYEILEINLGMLFILRI